MFSYLRSLINLSWPMFIAQLAIMAHGVVDTIMVGHYHVDHLAAFSIGASIYISAYIGLMGVLQALSPLVAQNFGAAHFKAIGNDVRQFIWLALGLSAVGILLMVFPDPFMWLANPSPQVENLAREYLLQLAWGLPGALLARVFYAFTPAVGYPKPVMLINLTSLLLKIPLSYLLLYGDLGFPELGVRGCGIATSCASWLMAIMALFFAVRISRYQEFELFNYFTWPSWKKLKPILGLGLPIGFSLVVEVTSFTFIALFLARMGAEISAGHQIVANLTGLLYMLPLSIANGTSVLVGQAIGRGEFQAARHISLLGINFTGVLALVISTFVLFFQNQIIGLYTNDNSISAVAHELIFFTALYHVFDALQIVITFALRGYKRTVIPTVIYIMALWGVGLGIGYLLSFQTGKFWNLPLGASGFWLASVLSVILVVILQLCYFQFVSNRIITKNEK